MELFSDYKTKGYEISADVLEVTWNALDNKGDEDFIVQLETQEEGTIERRISCTKNCRTYFLYDKLSVGSSYTVTVQGTGEGGILYTVEDQIEIINKKEGKMFHLKYS